MVGLFGSTGILLLFARCARSDNGSQINAKMKIILQENRVIHRKQHKAHFSVHVLVFSATYARIHFF